MTRRSVVLLTALALLLLLVPAIGHAETVTLRLAHWGENPGIRNAIDEFNASQERIKIEFDPSAGWPDFFEVIPVQIAAGVGPDIFSGNFTNMPLRTWAKEGVLLDLQRYWDRDAVELNAEDWFDFVFDAVRADGKLIGFPYGFAVFGILAYSTQVFDEAALAYPDTSWTWESVTEAARRINRDENGDGIYDRWGMDSSFHNWRQVEAYIRSAGGSVFNADENGLAINADAARRALSYLADRHIEGTYPPAGQGDIRNPQRGMTFGWGVQHVLGLLPAMTANNVRPGIAVGPADPVTGGRLFPGSPEFLVVNAQTPHPDEVWEFLKWFTTEEGYARASHSAWGFVQFMPVRRSAVLGGRYYMYPDPNYVPSTIDMMVTLELAQYAAFDRIPDNPALAGSMASITSLLQTEWQRVLARENSLNAFIDDMTNRVREMLQN